MERSDHIDITEEMVKAGCDEFSASASGLTGSGSTSPSDDVVGSFDDLDDRFPLPCRFRLICWLDRRRIGQVAVGHAPISDSADCRHETVLLVALPSVETEALFIQIPEPVEWLHADICLARRPLSSVRRTLDWTRAPSARALAP